MFDKLWRGFLMAVAFTRENGLSLLYAHTAAWSHSFFSIISNYATSSGSRNDSKYGVCGFGKIHGLPVDIVANNGILYSDSSLETAHFIQLSRQHIKCLYSLYKIPMASWLVKKPKKMPSQRTGQT